MSNKTIYFLCTGNSCRSQMAEGWAKKYLGDGWEVKSAGIEAHGLNPNAVKAMKEVDIDISKQNSEIIDTEFLNNATLAVTLCGDAADKCPVTPSHVRREHWGFDDPAKAKGTEEEKWKVFQRVRDEIEERIKRFADTGE
ncbi:MULTISPECIES: arsenate reductase (thioredoxin) [Oceanobacillus]|uniref:Arsenate reductase n=1 Tax=Oceanobacillus profundus TaxID=372463 RepID=A0A417YF75_9BACI|nr:arsenate reductase (thioredoxin) [Oceanobacillus profundus]MBR3120538.1 arsenate reductase (thioredoxin) [Oceanobacillus sp.]PAE28711.1 arsenate reductase (thioredoxin) [Paenibacillus sp. 7884-2]MCM3397160.1 arsenate reductase (thioredoxin) [Oceanobacillus profundus]MDO6449398.1 arsenate reductase (thioredoxin) [Oceanobacillus profundus]RHW31347.1 arsenate reductase (thioredoxin) [Oceanobacillus profundus]